SGKRTIDEKEIPETPIVRRKITINRDPENNDLVTIDLKKYFSGERQPTQLGLEQKEHPNVSFQDATELAIEDGKILDTEEKFLESEYISQRTQGVEHPKISVALPKGWKKLVSKGEQENVIEDDPTQPLL
ncbi:MAG: hypothetical protein GWN01_03770, partial [Nitrosopumilaceae archaeon]|nr:hypothetical protein [Nitrosopumilaceae archaeon]NIU86458.1 hypothetical protein [Nitrosopumilaceae archaeon]NIV65224.1 hypothetical protein [Nitrosopumilaceae archaeon]NIX60676.1 hypothetical protein [Nitrosopumilaceae archaeon]